jgi:beta-glucosidase
MLHNIQLTSVQFPGTNYPGSEVPYAVAGAQFNQTSPPYYPSPWGTGAGEWASAYEKAIAFVSKLTLAEKVNLTTGMFCHHNLRELSFANLLQVLGQFSFNLDI